MASLESYLDYNCRCDRFATTLGDSTVYQLGKEFCKHGTCPVPGAILKGVEVACGLALPKDVHVEILKKD